MMRSKNDSTSKAATGEKPGIKDPYFYSSCNCAKLVSSMPANF